MGKTTRNQKKKLSKKKKELSIYSKEDLLKKIQDEIDMFNYKEAQKYCQEILERDADDLRALEISATLCIETENFEGAKHCLGRAITLAPENGFTKYLSMGQLLEGRDSLQCYLKGIELINLSIKEENKSLGNANSISELAEQKKNLEETDKKSNLTTSNINGNTEEQTKLDYPANPLIRKLSNAYCAVAELFMSDLCDEDEAEEESLAYIQKAISVDSSNPEAYQHYANFLVIKEDLDTAKENIKKSVALWLPKYQEIEDGEASAGSFDPVEICPLTQSARSITARILMEVEEHQLAADVLETLLGEDDENVYTWYLLGWNHYLRGEEHKFEAKQHFEKAFEVNGVNPTVDESIVKHMKELLIELKDVKDNEEDIEDCVEDLERDIEEMEVS